MSVLDPRRRRRTTLILLLLTSITMLSLDYQGFRPLNQVQSAVRSIVDPLAGSSDSVTSPITNAWRSFSEFDDLEKHAQPFTIDFAHQGVGDLGQRLERATTQAFDDGYAKVAVIGTDCIHCGSRWINAAFLQTSTDRCVLGPSDDGGYYLLSTARKSTSLFQNIPWSSTDTLRMTEQAAVASKLTVVRLPPLVDIDDEADWEEVLNSAIGGKLRAAHKREN